MGKQLSTPTAILLGSAVIAAAILLGSAVIAAAVYFGPRDGGVAERAPARPAAREEAPAPRGEHGAAAARPVGAAAASFSEGVGPVGAPAGPAGEDARPAGALAVPRDEVARQAARALDAHRAALVSRCHAPAIAAQPEPRVVRYVFNFTFDARGRQLARGLIEDRETARPEITACLAAALPPIAIPPPGATVRVDVPFSLP